MYPGVVVDVHRTGLLDVQYDDGDFEESVEPSMVRRVLSGPAIEASVKRRSAGVDDPLTSLGTSARPETPPPPASAESVERQGQAAHAPTHAGAHAQAQAIAEQAHAQAHMQAQTQAQAKAQAQTQTQTPAQTPTQTAAPPHPPARPHQQPSETLPQTPLCEPGVRVWALYGVRAFLFLFVSNAHTHINACMRRQKNRAATQSGPATDNNVTST